MKLNMFQLQSLKTRVTLFTLAIFLIGIWSLAFYASRMLREDLQGVLGGQQLSTATFMAAEINDELRDRASALELVAGSLAPAMLGKAVALQAILEQHSLLSLLFNGGAFVTGLDSTVIADVPLSAGRIGVKLTDRDHIATAIREGKPTIGRPVMGRVLRAPLFGMVVPIRDAQGKVMGALVGSTDLGKPNFLDKITGNRYGNTGGYLLIARQHRLIVTSSDRNRIMEALPAPGINPTIDRFVQGDEGSAVLVNAAGVEVLFSSKAIPEAGWSLSVSLPTEEAFAPIHVMQQRMFLATIFFTLLAGGLTWWMLRRQLSPMLAAAKTLATLSDANQLPRLLPIARQDEIGELIGGFNRLLEALRHREDALRDSDARFRSLTNMSSDFYWESDAEHRLTTRGSADKTSSVSVFRQGMQIGQRRWEIPYLSPDEAGWRAHRAVLDAHLPFRHFELSRLGVDGTERYISISGDPVFDATGAFKGYRGVGTDISERKRAEQALRESDERNRTLLAVSPDGIWIHNNARIAYVNDALVRMLGYENPQELVGREIYEFFVPEFREPLRERVAQVVTTLGHAPLTETAMLRRNASRLEVETTATAFRQGDVVWNLSIIRNITERKRVEQALRESEYVYRTMIDSAPEGVWMIGPDRRTTEVNQGMCHLLGYAREAMLGRIPVEFADAENGKVFDEQSRTVPSRQTRTFEIALRHRDGRNIPTEFHVTNLFNEDKSVMGALAFVVDLTERKQAEERLHLAASVFTHAREGIMIANPDGTIIDVNDTFSHITGYSRDEVVGRNERMLSSGRQGEAFLADMSRVLIEKGHWNGEVWNRRKNGEEYAEMRTISAVRDAQGNTKQYVALFSDITASKEHEKQLEHIAHYDALTGLPNRVLLADRLHQAIAQIQRRGQTLAVAYLDLDGFKAINDNHGHGAGDQMLIAIATRMKQALREGDTLARLGGDEFVAVLLDLADIESSEPMLTRLLSAAAQPLRVGDLVLQVSASLGVTFYPQSEDMDADQLLRQADQAMYQAKLAGKNRYHVFDAELDRSVRGHHESLERVRQALTERELVLYYQPKVNMRTGTVIGAEALIRWQHPERGLLLPAVFLPVIEDHPLAVEVGEWVIETALTQMELWQAAGLKLPVSVNVGAIQLQRGDFVERLRQILAAHPNVKLGELEVVETTALEDLARVSEIIQACREMGVRFALDDFGTGYSSLTYLKHLPITLLKIDQSFVHDMLDDPDDLAILQGVLGLAKAFRREVIAEGVESTEHGTLLLQLGCELAQGFGIARPMPAHEMSSWAAGWRPNSAWLNLRTISHEDLPLLFASAEHRAWVRAIEEHLKDEREIPPPLDHHQCHLGTWLDAEGQERYVAQPAFKAMELLHRKVHVLVAQMCDLHSRGRSLDVQAKLAELHGLRDALLEQLKVLEKEIR
jgi:diguanylate cyclase (GGDEF)-like protein/PAS domain S-box-containing protein